MFLEVKNLCFNYYRKPLCLKDINFSIEKGDKILLLASHEMGKTAFLSVISGFEKSYFGSIVIDGKELRTTKDEEINVSFLPEIPVFFKNKTIKQNLEYAFKCLGKNFEENKIREICSGFGLDYDSKVKIKNLSKLNQKKFAIARAYVKNANILFLDDQFKKLLEDEIKDMIDCYKIVLENKQSVICAIGEETYKNCKNILKSLKFNKVFYLCDANLRIFNSINDFDSEILTYDMLNFFEEKFEETKCFIEKQDRFYNVYIGDKFFSIKPKFNKYLDKLKLQIDDTEYVILCTKEKINTELINENDFNELLERKDTILFSSLSGERLF